MKAPRTLHAPCLLLGLALAAPAAAEGVLDDWSFPSRPADQLCVELRPVAIGAAGTIYLTDQVSVAPLVDGASLRASFAWQAEEELHGFECSAFVEAGKKGYRCSWTFRDLAGGAISRAELPLGPSGKMVVEVMEEPGSGRRLGMELTTAVRAVPFYQPFPAELGIPGSLLRLLDGPSWELAASPTVPVPAGRWTLHVEGRGLFLLSLSPFPGAGVVGGTEDWGLRFRFGEDCFELRPLEPGFPTGRWMLWGRRAADADRFFEQVCPTAVTGWLGAEWSCE